MRRQAKILMALVVALSVGLFALTALPKPGDALPAEDIYDADCTGTGAGAVLGNKKYAESFTAGHTGGLTRGFVNTYNVLEKAAVYAVEVWNADPSGIPTGTGPLASTAVYNPHRGYKPTYPVFSSPPRVTVGNNYALVVTVAEAAYNGVVALPGDPCVGTFSLDQSGTGAFTADSSNRDMQFAVFIDATPPAVSSLKATNVDPSGVARRNTKFRVTFSDDMKPTTINTATITLYRLRSDGSKVQIKGWTTVDCVANGTAGTLCRTAVLNPYGGSTTRLAANSRYRVVVTTDAEDRAGNSLSKRVGKTFKTGTK